MKLGSLFDGSGGFPLAGVINGMEPVWASEIEPYPLKVTAARFPNMVQLGDVTKINGAAIEPVDVITFGSPCQDLSVAGKQAGIHDGERSNLFFEAIRIIKEMRERDRAAGRADELCRPRFAVWENVPGAFSSNKGADFQAVLQALCEVTDASVSVPLPEKGKWQKAGCIVGDGYSIAWRVYDAQFWGVPQRRKRIYLIADFGSERAGEILFEREGVRGDSEESGTAREGTAADALGSTGRGCAAGFVGRQGDAAGSVAFELGKAPTLRGSITADVCYSVMPINTQAHGIVIPINDKATRYNGGNCTAQGPCAYENIQATLKASGVHGVVYAAYQDTVGALCMDDYKGPNSQYVDQAKLIVFDKQRISEYGQSGVTSTLAARDYKDATDLVVEQTPRKYTARRLTPLECCRLQGFPDWWEDGVEGSDSARYKMWGNGIALPCAVDVLSRIANATQNT